MPRLATNERVNKLRIRCYDNGGASIDRYTVVYIDHPQGELFTCVCMNAMPFHPCYGFGQHSVAKIGRHLGKRIAFADLPADCQKLVEWDTSAYA